MKLRRSAADALNVLVFTIDNAYMGTQTVREYNLISIMDSHDRPLYPSNAPWGYTSVKTNLKAGRILILGLTTYEMECNNSRNMRQINVVIKTEN